MMRSLLERERDGHGESAAVFTNAGSVISCGEQLAPIRDHRQINASTCGNTRWLTAHNTLPINPFERSDNEL